MQALGLLLERDQLGVDEIARALLQFRLLRGEPRGAPCGASW